MDVTALLNDNSFAVDQKRKRGEPLRLPTRSRTPWDAGGYSLPWSMTTTKITSPELERPEIIRIDEEESMTMIPFTSTPPASPSHKFTDSRSSFSSITSSSLHSATYSTTHSRYSSISTLSSPRTLNTGIPESLFSPKGPIQSVEISYIGSRDDEIRPRHYYEHSPTRSFDILAQIAEDHHSAYFLSPPKRAVREEMSSERRFPSQQPEETRPYRFLPHSRSVSNGGRIASGTPVVRSLPSSERNSRESTTSIVASTDALDLRQVNNISRPASPSDSLLIKRAALPSLHLDTQEQHLQTPYMTEKCNPSKAHKRAISAPNFAAMDISRPHPGRMAHEPTPPNSNHPDRASPQTPFGQSPPESPPGTTATPTTAPVCMYIDDCDTDSPQRKAISHIFGRNKMCTRMIPEHLWVHLCRKHYQRCRYRDQDKWAKAQCDLVQIQIRRIHDWSVANQANGSGTYLQHWTLTMRKREKLRREKLAQQAAVIPKRKRSASSQDEDEDVVERDETGYPSTATKVPDWLVAHCDKEYTTEGILVVFNRLHQDILDGRVGPHFPDLELLPSLLTPEGSSEKKPSSKPPVRKPHQRSQSLSTVTHESFFRDQIPSPKRRRANEELSSERVLPPLRQNRRSSIYPSINEHGDDVISAPVPQRPSGPSLVAHNETGGFSRGGRSGHRRSHSDFPQSMHSSREAQRGVFFGSMTAAATSSRNDPESRIKFSYPQEGFSFSAGPPPGPNQGIGERNVSIGLDGQRMAGSYRMEIEGQEQWMRSKRETAGGQDRMMVPRRRSIGSSQGQMMGYH